MEDVAALTPLLLDADPLAVEACPTGSTPLDLDTIWQRAAEALEEEDPNPAESGVLSALAETLLPAAPTWQAIDNLAALLAEPSASIHDAGELLVGVVELDPELNSLSTLSEWITDRDLVMPLLRIAENPRFMTELASSTVDRSGPLPWIAELQLGGTITDLLRLIDFALQQFHEPGNAAE